MNVKDLELVMMSEIIEQFKLFPIDKLKNAINLSEEETERMKTFITDFSSLASKMSDNNSFLYEIKIIFTAVMICSLKGMNSIYDLAQVVSDHMMPAGENADLAKEMMDSIIRDNPSIDKIKETILKKLKKPSSKSIDDPNLTNLKDENGNKMTVGQVEELFNASKQN